MNDKSPSRVVRELDNRGSHFYLAMYWAQALAEQNDDYELKNIFLAIANELSTNENGIVDELNSVQGPAVDLGGYYLTNDEIVSKAMRPSGTFNSILDSIGVRV